MPAGRGRPGPAWCCGRRNAAALIGGAILVALVIPVFALNLGEPKSSVLAQTGPAHRTLAALEAGGVPSGILEPIDVLVRGRRRARGGGRAGQGQRRLHGRRADRPRLSPGGHDSGRGPALRRASTSSGGSTVAAVRSTAAHLPGVIGVGGSGPEQVDFVHAVYGSFPLMLALIGVATLLLLTRAFRSVVLAVKAVLFNLLSVAAAYGVMVLVWQQGHGSQAVWSIPATGSITVWVPIMVFAFLFGLSMDYEVFILSRIREEYDRTGSTDGAVVVGIGRTGRLVTSAALILFLAFLSLSTAPMTDLKVMATGLGAGILLDALVMRSLLVPSLVGVLGRWNWYLPGLAGPGPLRPGAGAPAHPCRPAVSSRRRAARRWAAGRRAASGGSRLQGIGPRSPAGYCVRHPAGRSGRALPVPAPARAGPVHRPPGAGPLPGPAPFALRCRAGGAPRGRREAGSRCGGARQAARRLGPPPQPPLCRPPPMDSPPAGGRGLTLQRSEPSPGNMRPMLDHVSIQCQDVAESAAFYDAVLAPLGGQRIMDFGEVIGYGVPPRPDFWIGAGPDWRRLPGITPGLRSCGPGGGASLLRGRDRPAARRCSTRRGSGLSTTPTITALSCGTPTATMSKRSVTSRRVTTESDGARRRKDRPLCPIRRGGSASPAGSDAPAGSTGDDPPAGFAAAAPAALLPGSPDAATRAARHNSGSAAISRSHSSRSRSRKAAWMLRPAVSRCTVARRSRRCSGPFHLPDALHLGERHPVGDPTDPTAGGDGVGAVAAPREDSGSEVATSSGPARRAGAMLRHRPGGSARAARPPAPWSRPAGRSGGPRRWNGSRGPPAACRRRRPPTGTSQTVAIAHGSIMRTPWTRPRGIVSAAVWKQPGSQPRARRAPRPRSGGSRCSSRRNTLATRPISAVAVTLKAGPDCRRRDRRPG